MDEIRSIIMEYFPDISVTIEDGEIIISNTDYINLTIYNKEMKIEQLDKCTQYSGTEIMNKLISMSERLGVSGISLTDSSAIVIRGYKFDLATIKILSDGESWYNSFGFYSKKYEDELQKWNEIRTWKLEDILDAFKTMETEKLIKDFRLMRCVKKIFLDNMSSFEANIQITNQIKQIRLDMIKLINESNIFDKSSTVMDVFIEIKQILQTSEEFSDEAIITLYVLVSITSSIIPYQRFLYKKFNIS